jgi:hypothetical protein
LVIGCAAASAQAEFFPEGQLILTARNQSANDLSNKTNAGFSAFDAAAVRIFLDARATDRVSGFVQLYANDYSGATLYGAYVRYDHTASLHLEAGLIPTPVGLWGARTYADKNPLVGSPAMFQYKTSLETRGDLQSQAEEILDARGGAEHNPVVYDFCWNTGVHAYASAGQFDFGAALLNGSIGSTARQVTYDRPNVAGHVNFVPGPWLTVGVWGAAGPYLSPGAESVLPDGKRIEDYDQSSVGALAHAAMGHWEVYAEGLWNRYEHPFLGDLENLGGYVDARVDVAPKWFIAGRVDHLAFSRLDANVDSGRERWDFPLSRYEVGVGRNLSHKTLIKVVSQIVRYVGAPASLDDEIVALQFVANL